MTPQERKNFRWIMAQRVIVISHKRVDIRKLITLAIAEERDRCINAVKECGAEDPYGALSYAVEAIKETK